MRVRYVGPIFEPSGYGHAARTNILALLQAGVDVSTDTLPTYLNESHNFGSGQREITQRLNQTGPWDAQIIHYTPELWKRCYKDNVKVTVGMAVWETSDVHPLWTKVMNVPWIDEVWVPNKYNADVFQKTVIRPIYTVPHVVDTAAYDRCKLKLSINSVRPDSFMFYSIFQWTHRKNPDGLLYAYFTEFKPDEKVALVLKTSGTNFTKEDQSKITASISDTRLSLGKIDTPSLYLLMESLSDQQIVELHNRGDCYVSPHRGEGWGLPITEAMAACKPVITTGYGGPLEFCNGDNSYLVDHTLSPVHSMRWSPWYLGTQTWAEPSIMSIRKQMRNVFEHQAEAVGKGIAGRQTMEQYTPNKVGVRMRDRLAELLR